MTSEVVESFWRQKRSIPVVGAQVAYVDRGEGPPVLLIHGCPFHSYIWRRVISALEAEHRVLAPDLLGLGDTEVSLEADYRLPKQTEMILAFLDALGISETVIVGHDHGGAVAQMIAAEQPERISRLVLSNVECYNNWPSARERPEVELAVAPATGSLLFFGLRISFVRRLVFRSAVHSGAVLSNDFLREIVRPLASTRTRRLRTRRFLRWQLDSGHNRETERIVDKLRRFRKPTLLLWRRDDPHFGPEWAERLQRDIPGPTRLQLIADAGHLVMEDQPTAYARGLKAFLTD